MNSKMIIVCVTIIIVILLLLFAFYLYLNYLRDKEIDSLEEPKDDKIYKDRLKIVKFRYEDLKYAVDVTDTAIIPEEVQNFLSIVDALTKNIY